MKDFLVKEHQLTVCLTSIANFLDGKLISVKRIRIAPQARNLERVEDLRIHFAKWFVDIGQHKNVLYLDEFGVNVWMRQSFGRS